MGGVLLAVERGPVQTPVRRDGRGHRRTQLGDDVLGAVCGAREEVFEVGQDQAHAPPYRPSLALRCVRALL